MTTGGARYVAQRLGLLLVFACILFGAAGSLAWPRGWAYLGAVLAGEVGTLALLAARAPETLRQRGTGHAGVKPFERVFVVAFLTLSLATPVVAGLDAVRFQASQLPWSLFWVGLAVLLAALALGAWAMLENEHFEQCEAYAARSAPGAAADSVCQRPPLAHPSVTYKRTPAEATIGAFKSSLSGMHAERADGS